VNYTINERFALSSNKHNWILIESITPKSGKVYYRYRFYGSLEQLSKGLFDTVAKDTATRLSHDLREKAPPTEPYKLLMDNIVRDLAGFFAKVVKR